MDTLILASPNQYGYFTIYYNYAKYLSKEVKVIYVCFDQGENKFEESENIKVIYITLSNNKILNIFKYYQSIVQASNSNLKSKTLLKYYYFSSVLNLFLSRNDLILDIRTGYISRNKIKTLFYNTIIRIESLLFKRIITLSESLRKKLSLRISKTTIIPLGAEPIKEHRKTFDKLILLYVGTISSRNISQTIEGLSLYVNNPGMDREIQYYIVGGGNLSEVKKLKDSIDHFGLEEIVHYEGPVYGEKLKWYFANCNIGVSYIPMIEDYECQPATKTVEYMSAGMPVIATGTLENKIIISDFNGILIEDNPQSFANGLSEIIAVGNAYNSGIIKNSVKEYSYEKIINNKLKPILFS